MKKIFYSIVCFMLVIISTDSIAQTWNTTGNAGTVPGTNFIGTTDAKDFVFKTNSVEKGRIKSNGLWQFGVTGNFAKIDSGGNLSFTGTAAYKVAANKYAFQYAGNPNYGLFFNSTNLLYEFRTSTALSVFSIGAKSGNGIFKGNLKVGAYTLPATDGTTGQVLKTDGAGALTWSADNGTSYSAGTGIGIVAGVISNTGDTNAGDDITTASTAGGDVSGTFSSISVNKIKGVTVSSTAPVNTQVLKYNSGTSNWEPATDANTTYSAGTGITFSGTTINNNLSTGVAGGQNVYGGTAAGNNLTLNSTTNGTKGKINFGSSSVYDEVNNRLGISTTSPSAPVQVYTGAAASLAGTGYVVLGNVAGNNLAMDNGVIQSRFNSGGATLYLNYYGGDTRIGGSGAEMFEVNDAGNIGVGTFASTQKVNIQGTTSSSDNVLYVKANYSAGSSDVVGINSISQIADGYGIGITSSGGYKGLQGTANAGAYVGTGYGVLGYAYGTAGTRIGVYGLASGGTTNWAGYFSGNTYAQLMSIGTTSPATGYTLSVNGKIICTEARVEAFANWPDFVFKNDYQLMPLNELEKNIKLENHLPGIPSADEIECTGFDLGDMQAKLLQKIEELSLYLIDLNKENEELKVRITNLENK